MCANERIMLNYCCYIKILETIKLCAKKNELGLI